MRHRRFTIYALALLAVSLPLQVRRVVNSDESFAAQTDFPAFYDAGRNLNELPRGSLYDAEAQQRLYRETAPDAPEGSALPFVYPPWFAALFSPAARLPYVAAYLVWLAFSLALFVAGFVYLWGALGLWPEWRWAALAVAVAFAPFHVYTLLGGQTAAFGFFWLALAVGLERRGRLFLSGAALGFLTYKPPLLLFVLPLLLLSGRWKQLKGWCAAAAALGALSVAVVGVDGAFAYAGALRRYAALKSSGVNFPLFKFVDAQSALQLVGVPHARVVVAALALAALPFAVRVWRRRPAAAWPFAVALTLLLSGYTPIYDTSLAVVAALAALSARGAERRLLAAFALLFVSGFATQILAGALNFPLMTAALAAFAVLLYTERPRTPPA
ncbi:MAG TPA: glycosyltransferase family 87 protein [Pyrinomonadaceae bacterium]